MVQEELKKWQELGVIGQLEGERQWSKIGDDMLHQMAGIVGARESEGLHGARPSRFLTEIITQLAYGGASWGIPASWGAGRLDLEGAR